jgi:two-component system sensor kinase FixL
MAAFLYDLIIGMLVVSAISMACVGLYGRRFASRIPAAVPYALLMFAAAAWALLYALDLLTTSLSLRVVFHNLRFLVLPFIPVLELWLVIAFVKKSEWLRKDRAAAVLAIPVAAALLAITSPWHTLFRYNFSIDTSGPVPVLQYSEGPFYTLYFAYSFILLVITVIILIVGSRKRGSFWQEQNILLLLALAFPTVINYLFFFGITPVPGINMTPALLWVAALLYTIALFRYRFLDIIPIARSRLIESMGTPMLVLDPEGRIIDLNPAACSLFSTTEAAALGMPVAGLVPGWPDFLRLCLQDGACHADLVREQAGGTRYFSGSVELIRTLSGELEGRLVLLQDVTEQKNAERALHESEEKFSRAFRSAPYAILITRMADGFILDTNEAFEKMTGYSPDEVAGKTTLDLNLWVREPDRRSVVHDLEQKIQVAGREYEFRNRSGQVFTGLFSTEIITVRDQPYILSSIYDITERRKAAEDLRETNEYLKNLLDYANAPIIVWDPAFRITRFNHAFERLTGRTEQEVIGQPLPILFPPATLEASLEMIRKTYEGERWETVEIPILHVSGVTRIVLWNSANIADPAGTIISTIAQGQDITDRKLTETQREALIHELEQKNAELDRFAYTVSHDLKSPLVTIRGFLGLLEEDIRKNDPVQAQEDIGRINSAAATMERLISTLLDLSRSGRSVDVPTRILFSELAREAAGLLATSLSDRHVTLVIPDNLPEVAGDRQRLLQVMTNLLDNAVKFMGSQKEPRVEVGVRAGAGTPVFFVRDNGSGMKKENQQKAFSLFERFNPGIPGSGIGLATVKRIIEAHGGWIRMESEGEGKGTTVCFTLPGLPEPEKRTV